MGDLRARPSLSAHITDRLGAGARTQLGNWLRRSFAGANLTEFWRHWNPVYGYGLYWWCYRPARRVVPRPIAVLFTFAVCGFALHDAVGWLLVRRVRFPEMTVLFLIFGVEVVASQALRLEWRRASTPVRVAANAACLGGALGVTMLIARVVS